MFGMALYAGMFQLFLEERTVVLGSLGAQMIIYSVPLTIDTKDYNNVMLG
jgi:hypothetical protein